MFSDRDRSRDRQITEMIEEERKTKRKGPIPRTPDRIA